MKWCLTCKIEFEDYMDTCTECGAMLISEEEYNLHTAPKKFAYNPDDINLSVVYESTLESDVLHVTELLKDNGIDSEIKTHGMGSYLQIYSGVNYLGTSICVKEEDAEAAKALIEEFWRASDTEVQIDIDTDDAAETIRVTDQEAIEMEDYRRTYNKSLNRKRNLLKLILLLLFGTSLVIQLISILN